MGTDDKSERENETLSDIIYRVVRVFGKRLGNMVKAFVLFCVCLCRLVGKLLMFYDFTSCTFRY